MRYGYDGDLLFSSDGVARLCNHVDRTNTVGGGGESLSQSSPSRSRAEFLSRSPLPWEATTTSTTHHTPHILGPGPGEEDGVWRLG